MMDEKEDFVEALLRYVAAELRASFEPAEYNNEAVRIVDARNHLFQNVGRQANDEERGIYTLRSLCHVDEDTFDTVPDPARIRSIAKNYFD